MNDTGGDVGENLQENLYAPRRFVFEVPNIKTKHSRQLSSEIKTLKKNLEAEKYMPFVFSFPEPESYKDSYSLIVKNILGVYNHLRLLVVEEHYEKFKHIIQEFKIQQPSDCLSIIKEILNHCCEKLRTLSAERKDEQEADLDNDYEELLQKAEAKIRVFIRNEQIFRINFDLLSQKIEDLEKSGQEAQLEKDTMKEAQEALIKENLELKSKLRQKDDDLKKLQKDNEGVQKRQRTNNSDTFERLNQTMNAVSRKNEAIQQNWNNQLLNMLIRENKSTPTEISGRFLPSAEFRTLGNELRSCTSQSTAGDRHQNSRKGNVFASILNVSSGNLRKSDKNSMTTELKRITDPQKTLLNSSLDITLNKSIEFSQERNSVGTTSFSAKKKDTHNFKPGNSYDKIKIKAPEKDKKLGEHSDRNLSALLSNKAALQKIISMNNPYNNVPTRPTNTSKSRDNSIVSRNRTQPDSSPEKKPYESKVIHAYVTSSQGVDGGSKRKSSKSKDSKVQNKGSAKSSFTIKNMIAEQLNKKLGFKGNFFQA